MLELPICVNCKGHGEIIHRIVRDEEDQSYEKVRTRCYECMGVGAIPNDYCSFCKALHKANFHAEIEWQMNHDVIAIFDQNKGARSVTNDAEYVIWLIEQQLSELTNNQFKIKLFPRWRIIYRDSDGYWDEICQDTNGMLFFRAIAYHDKRTKDLKVVYKIVSKKAMSL